MAETFVNQTFGAGQASTGLLLGNTFTGTNLASGAASITINGNIDLPGSPVTVDSTLVGIAGFGLQGSYLGFTAIPNSQEAIDYFRVEPAGIGTPVTVAVRNAPLPPLQVGVAVDTTNVSAPDSPTIVCFTEGTQILTDRGEVPVESLQVGDLVVTASGEQRPVKWLGHRTMDPRRHARPEIAMPVRIRAGALRENQPSRDLVVSPGHAIALDIVGEILVPAFSLINGATIVQEEVESVTYWHVELDSHDLLVANGQATESYLDMGNRTFFGRRSGEAANGVLIDLGAGPDADPAQRTHADFCRPFHQTGALVEFVHERLCARARALGWRLDEEAWAHAHLIVDGRRVDPETRGLTARFVVPAGAKEVWLVSQTNVPRHLGMSHKDGRALGLCLAGLRIDDGWNGPRAVALDDPLLCLGFHEMEGPQGKRRRWTAGRARLPSGLWTGSTGSFQLWLDLHRAALPRWIAPQVAAQRATLSAVAA